MGRYWREEGLVMLKAEYSCLLLTPLSEGLARIMAPDDRISTTDTSVFLGSSPLKTVYQSIYGYGLLYKKVWWYCLDSMHTHTLFPVAKKTLQGLHNILTTKLDFHQSDFAALRLVYNLCFHTTLPPESSQLSQNVTAFIYWGFDYYFNLDKLWLLQFLKLLQLLKIYLASY